MHPITLPGEQGLIKVFMDITAEKRGIPAKLGLPVVKYKVLKNHELISENLGYIRPLKIEI